MLLEYSREKLPYTQTKALFQPCNPSTSNKRIRIFTILLSCLALWFLFPRHLPCGSSTSYRSPYAFVTFLAQHPNHDNKTVPDSEDHYYIASRTLAYQLLHAPETRTNTSIPFVVLVTKDIAAHKVDRLRQDGATVKVVENIEASWMESGMKKWRHTMDKLYLFAMTEYEKVLFIDADMLIVKRLDSVFIDHTTAPKMVDPTLALEDEGPLPISYVLSAQAAFETAHHDYPPSTEYSATGHLSSGFFVASPCLKMYEYYIQLSKMEGRFRDNAMEQDLLNYAHRRDGPMPWTDITYTWTTTWPSMREYKAGAATLHEKFWEENLRIDLGIRKLWYEAKGAMEGYWNAKEEM